MSNSIYSIITGTGSYIPTKRIKNEDFLNHEFLESDGSKIEKSNQEIIEKFLEITTIAERRYVTDDLSNSDIAYFAALEAIKSANIDKEELDYIIVAHNFGELKNGNKQVDIVPSVASRLKFKLGIKNPTTVAYDIPFGCPGWLQGIIQADYFIKSGDAKKILVIGADILSRICDPHDRDSMLYADGAGATVLEGKESNTPIGILAHRTRSDTLLYSDNLTMGKSYNKDIENKNDLFIKMNGRKLYQYALETVPQAIQSCLEKSNTPLSEIKKILIHQANGKMDEAILKRLYRLYDIVEMPEGIMPMTIDWLGNSSVATVPTLLDLILKGKMESHEINKGDTIVLSSVGAGMNINAVTYKM
ncbi:MAG: ketoacyl-ACP synthase III [Bacteroidales bacterium]|jgi:3-oxoacyl-[acyl-carrier-protein] synthase-3|nr:ketoacyl-ACP synthase III [Bacteroidales bacterium]